MRCRVLALIAIAATMLHRAEAQFGDTPGLPGGRPGAPFLGPPVQRSAQCHELLALRDKWQTDGATITAAVKAARTDVRVLCRVLRTYIANEATLIKALDSHGTSCGVPQLMNQQVRGNHAKMRQIAKQVCDAAARGPFRHDALPIDEDELRTFRLHPDRRPEPWPARKS
jgi:hypothetical protein